MEHNFFFYNKLKNEYNINKIHNDYSITESFLIINKGQYPSLFYNNEIKKDILSNNDIKVYGKFVKFNNITLDNIVKNIINLNISQNRKYNMFKINNYSISTNSNSDNVVNKSWIII